MSPRAWIQPALRLCAWHASDPHAYRQRRARRRRSAGRLFAAARKRWRGRIELQGAPLFTIDFALDEAHMRTVEAMGRSLWLGPVRRGDLYCAAAAGKARPAVLLAARKGYDLDFHVDETADPAAVSLGIIAQAALDHALPAASSSAIAARWPGRARRRQKRTIDLVARAGLHVVSLPMCNLYLQDARRPARRAGAASPLTNEGGGRQGDDRQRQYPRFLLSVRRSRHDGSLARGRAHSSSRSSRRTLGARLFTAPAQRDGPWRRRAQGRRARRSHPHPRAFVHRTVRAPQHDRTVLRAGAPVSAALPAYGELDRLEGLHHELRHCRVREAIGPIPCEDNPVLVRQKSRDFYWYSPILKRELDAVTADLIVTPEERGGSRRSLGRRLSPANSRHAARRGHRQLRSGHPLAAGSS